MKISTTLCCVLVILSLWIPTSSAHAESTVSDANEAYGVMNETRNQAISDYDTANSWEMDTSFYSGFIVMRFNAVESRMSLQDRIQYNLLMNNALSRQNDGDSAWRTANDHFNSGDIYRGLGNNWYSLENWDNAITNYQMANSFYDLSVQGYDNATQYYMTALIHLEDASNLVALYE